LQIKAESQGGKKVKGTRGARVNRMAWGGTGDKEDLLREPSANAVKG